MEDLADSFPVVDGMLVVIQTSIDKHIFKAPSSESIISEGVFHCNALFGSLHQFNAALLLPSKVQ
ncbi:hypothetical protein ECP029943810_1676 [Escherichia coli P0299438.10]|nr:hypothetical protein EC2016001_2160 [Escherichia coli 201600.1]ENB88753.1 hypothetical protein ECP029943810_1676 [Escherichia coli P0299438.10]ENC05383.1 hypothetical protein ECP02994384_1755 [Escherichia coli P0299438.4]